MKGAVLIVAVVTALAAAGCGSDDDPTATQTRASGTSPSLSPDAPTDLDTSSPSATGAATSSPASGPTTTPLPGAPATRASTSVDCAEESKFCSRSVTMRLSGDDLSVAPQRNITRGGSSSPNITMVSTVVAPGGDEAGVGDEVAKIHVEVAVRNTTNKTFVFASRDVSLLVQKEGSEYGVLSTTGEGFEMTPDSKMIAKFDQPIVSDGTYKWFARTWFYEKT